MENYFLRFRFDLTIDIYKTEANISVCVNLKNSISEHCVSVN